MSPRAFSYHRALAPMIWVLVALATIELLVVHMLVSFWQPRVAMILSIVTFAGIAWLVRVILSFRHRPVLLYADRIVMRAGRLRELIVPIASIASTPTQWDASRIKGRGVLNLALIAYPNVMLILDPPIAGRRSTITTIAHRLDDPAAFAEALNAVRDAA